MYNCNIFLVKRVDKMNRTKRKIFNVAMKLFSEKGYDATSVEEITATVGVAKGTLYYHFSSKEEIYNFLIEEGMKLLHNSIEIKTENLTDPILKLKAVIIIQLKVIMKYNEFITILLSQIWGNEQRHQQSRKYIDEYIDVYHKEEILEYLCETEVDNVETAQKELGEDEYTLEEIRLMRIKFLSDKGN